VNAADFAAMSDPARNPQFSRQWLPPPLKRKRHPAANWAALEIFNSNSNNSEAHDSDFRFAKQAERIWPIF
jgi:hypothetical protein